jgi:hypothetical protein
MNFNKQIMVKKLPAGNEVPLITADQRTPENIMNGVKKAARFVYFDIAPLSSAGISGTDPTTEILNTHRKI